MDLRQHFSFVRHVLQHLVQEDRVEVFVRKGERFEIAFHHAVFENGMTMGQPDFVRGVFETKGVDPIAFGQREDIFARAAATIEEPRR